MTCRIVSLLHPPFFTETHAGKRYCCVKYVSVTKRLLQVFDSNNDQRISREEFKSGMKKLRDLVERFFSAVPHVLVCSTLLEG